MKAGYLKFWRGWLNHKALKGGPFDKRSAWAWLIERAAFKPTTQTVGGTRVSIERGEAAVSHRMLGQEWGWERTRVKRFLDSLQGDSMVSMRQVPAPSTGLGVTVLTICNYDRFQDSPNGAFQESAPSTLHQTLHQTPHQEDAGDPHIVLDFSAAKRAVCPIKRSIKRPTIEKEVKEKVSTSFEDWWALVPNKMDKAHARRAYGKALAKTTAVTLAEQYRRYLASVEHQRASGFRDLKHKYPATWLNKECWEDDFAEDGAAGQKPAWARNFERAQAEGRADEWLAENRNGAA